MDGTGTRISTYTYDPATYLATTTQRAGGTRLYSVTFSGAFGFIRDAFNRVVTKARERIFGLNKTTSIANSADAKTVARVYDAAGNLSSVTDEEGRTTNSAFDGVNRVISVTRAVGTSVEQTTATSYADAFAAVPSEVTEPSVWAGHNKVTSYVYGDVRFPLLPTGVAVSGFTPAGLAVSRTFGLAYSAAGQVALIDGPRTDVADTTTIEYCQCTTGAQLRSAQADHERPGPIDNVRFVRRCRQADAADRHRWRGHQLLV